MDDDVDRRAKNKKLRSGLILAILSLVFSLALVEIGVRLFFPVTDMVYSEGDPILGFRRIPGLEGRYITGAFGEINAHFRINNDGWNAARDYYPEKQVWRIAVIGDSYVEAFHVDIDQAFPELIEQTLQEQTGCPPVEVYRFGQSGVPLSQYVHIMEYVAETYHPDMYIINLFDNDFYESIYEPGVEKSYWQIIPGDDGQFTFSPPSQYEPDERMRVFYETLAVRRFLWGNLQMDLLLSAHGQKSIDDEVIEAGTLFLFEELKAIAEDEGADLLLIQEGARSKIYGEPPYEWEKPAHRTMAQNTAEALGINYLDLDPYFEADYAQYGERFEFKVDSHWNGRGHRVVAQATSDWLIEKYCNTGEE